MHVGFIHGVMNTDNTSISGETIDYGPCAFMDNYDPNTVFSSIDHHGRYAYGNQPNIAQWNIACLGQCLLPLINTERNKAIEIVEEILDGFADAFRKYWLNGMYKKIGLLENKKNNHILLDELLRLMEKDKSDFTLTFRYLSNLVEEENNNSLFKQQFLSKNEIDSWLVKWKECLKKEGNSEKEIKKLMLKVNPAFIPRNHQVEKAIYEVINNYDYSYVNRLIELLNKPYNYQPDNLEYMNPPDNYDQNYQTFCGT